MKKITRFLLLLFVFLMPFEISDIIYQSVSFTGKFSIYNTVYLHLNDIIFGLILIFSAFLYQKEQIEIYIKTNGILFNCFLFIIIFISIQSLLLDVNFLAFSYFFRIIELFTVYVLLNSNLTKYSELKFIFLMSALLQVFIAILQYIKQGSIGLSFLGESVLSLETANIAKVDFGNTQIIRSYGTLPHPNILAAYLATAFYIALSFYKKQKILIFFSLIFLSIGILMTMSRGVIISFLLSLIFITSISTFNSKKKNKRKKKYTIFALIFLIFYVIFLNSQSVFEKRFNFSDMHTISERLNQIEIAIKMITNNPLGYGLSSFTNQMQNFNDISLNPWEFQPVHNLFLLTASELGVIVAVLLVFCFLYSIYIFYKNKRYFDLSFLIFVFCIANLDHYFYDIYAGQLLFVFSLLLFNHKDNENMCTDSSN